MYLKRLFEGPTLGLRKKKLWKKTIYFPNKIRYNQVTMVPIVRLIINQLQS